MNNSNPDRVPGECDWFIDHNFFKRWQESQSSSLLWVSAYPGRGKSALAKHLVEYTLPTTDYRTTCYFFFKNDAEDQRTAASALCCILHQLFTRRRDLFSEELVSKLESHLPHLTSSFTELWEALVMVSQDQRANEIVCIIDAFDECADAERKTLSRALCRFYDPENNTKDHANLKFLVTSRPYDNMLQGCQPHSIPGLPVIRLEAKGDTELPLTSSVMWKTISVTPSGRPHHTNQGVDVDVLEISGPRCLEDANVHRWLQDMAATDDMAYTFCIQSVSLGEANRRPLASTLENYLEKKRCCIIVAYGTGVRHVEDALADISKSTACDLLEEILGIFFVPDLTDYGRTTIESRGPTALNADDFYQILSNFQVYCFCKV